MFSVLLSLDFKGQEAISRTGHWEKRAFPGSMLGSGTSNPFFSVPIMEGEERVIL